MSERLTKSYRESLLKKVMIHKYRTQVEALSARYKDLAGRVKDSMFSEEELELLKTIPSGWLHTQYHVEAIFGFKKESLNFNGRRIDYYFNPTRSGFPSWIYADKENIEYFVPKYAKFEASHELSKLHEDISNAEMRLKEEFYTSYKKLEAALNSVTTKGKLIQVWPEMNYFVEITEKVVNTLPAIQTEELNKIFGLPVEEKEAA